MRTGKARRTGRGPTEFLHRSLTVATSAQIRRPSMTAVGYAGLYLLVALAVAIYHFRQRDL